MRLATTFILSALSALHLTTAFNRHSIHHNHHLTRSVALRQHHERRALLDVCAYIDADLLSQQSILGIPLGALLDIDICLCLSALPLYLESNTKVLAIIELFGLDEVTAILKALINFSPTSKGCSYPDHSTPFCMMGDVCGFTCNPPYVRDGQYCVCQFPNTECNGQCGSFSHGCVSAVPRSLADGGGNSRIRGISSIINQHSRAKIFCKPEEEVCGTFRGRQSFECLDIKTNLESCGGCAIPNPFLPEDAQVRGADCSSLPGVDEVTCSSGVCVVRRCKNGWELNQRGDACRRVYIDITTELVTQVAATRRSLKKLKKVNVNMRSLVKSEDLNSGSASAENGHQVDSNLLATANLDLLDTQSLTSEDKDGLIPWNRQAT